MKEFDKVKEKKKNDDFKGVLFIGFIFVIAVGIIVFIIIQLTNQYLELKEKLVDTEKEVGMTMTNPDDSQNKIVITQNSTKVVKVDEIEKDIDNLKVSDALAEKENKNKNENIKENQKVEQKSPEKEPVKKVTTPVQTKKIPSNKTSRKNNEKNTKPVDKSKKNEIVVNTKRKYVIQLMAFKDKAVAESELKKIKKIYPDAFIMKIDLGKKGVWYRLRCCYLDDYAKAKEKVSEIKKKLKVNPIIVKTDK